MPEKYYCHGDTLQHEPLLKCITIFKFGHVASYLVLILFWFQTLALLIYYHIHWIIITSRSSVFLVMHMLESACLPIVQLPCSFTSALSHHIFVLRFLFYCWCWQVPSSVLNLYFVHVTWGASYFVWFHPPTKSTRVGGFLFGFVLCFYSEIPRPSQPPLATTEGMWNDDNLFLALCPWVQCLISQCVVVLLVYLFIFLYFWSWISLLFEAWSEAHELDFIWVCVVLLPFTNPKTKHWRWLKVCGKIPSV